MRSLVPGRFHWTQQHCVAASGPRIAAGLRLAKGVSPVRDGRCTDHGDPCSAAAAATPAERSAAYRARRKATVAAAPTKPPVIVRYRRPADRRSRPQQWADAVQTLADLLDRFQEWRDNLPSSLANSATAEALDAVLELRGYVEELQAVDLPKGFGRD